MNVPLIVESAALAERLNAQYVAPSQSAPINIPAHKSVVYWMDDVGIDIQTST